MTCTRVLCQAFGCQLEPPCDVMRAEGDNGLDNLRSWICGLCGTRNPPEKRVCDCVRFREKGWAEK